MNSALNFAWNYEIRSCYYFFYGIMLTGYSENSMPTHLECRCGKSRLKREVLNWIPRTTLEITKVTRMLASLPNKILDQINVIYFIPLSICLFLGIIESANYDLQKLEWWPGTLSYKYIFQLQGKLVRDHINVHTF